MITFANAALLAESLRSAETAHKESGQPADGWADWYSHYIDARLHRMETMQGTVEVWLPGDSAPTRINIPAQGKPYETKL